MIRHYSEYVIHLMQLMWGAYSSWIFQNGPFFEFSLFPMKLMYGCGEISLGFCSIFWKCKHCIRKVEVLQQLHGAIATCISTTLSLDHSPRCIRIPNLRVVGGGINGSLFLMHNQKKYGKKLQLGYTSATWQQLSKCKKGKFVRVHCFTLKLSECARSCM